MVRGAECGQVFWLPDHGRLRPSQAARLDETGCSVAHGGDGLPGYSGATAPELHRTSLDPHLLGAVFHGGVGFPLAVISQKLAPVGKLKSWRVEELKSPWTRCDLSNFPTSSRSEEHTSELQS